MVGAVFLALAHSPVIYIPPTPESLTSPVLSYDCELVSEAFERRRLRFHTEGGRGYRSRGGTAVHTPIRHIVDLDETGELDGMRQFGEITAERGARFAREGADATITEVTPYMKGDGSGWRASLILTVDYGPNVRRYGGFCQVQTREQQPLSEAETRDMVSQ